MFLFCRYRSVPLTTTFIGVKKRNEADIMDLVCYDKVIEFIRDGHQVNNGNKKKTFTIPIIIIGIDRMPGINYLNRSHCVSTIDVL